MMSLTLLRFCGSPFFLFVELSSPYVAAVIIISVSHHLRVLSRRARASGEELSSRKPFFFNLVFTINSKVTINLLYTTP